MKMKGIILASMFAALLLLPPALAHEDPEKFLLPLDIVLLSPKEAFPEEEIKVEIEMFKEGKPLEGMQLKFVIDEHSMGYTTVLNAEEHEPGHYAANHTFTYSGIHEIHVVDVSENTVKKTFYFNVGSSGFEQYFLTTIILILAAIALKELRSRRMKKLIVVLIAIFVIIGLSAAGLLASTIRNEPLFVIVVFIFAFIAVIRLSTKPKRPFGKTLRRF